MSFQRRVAKEIEDFQKNPLPGIVAGPVGDDISKWEAVVDGPAGSPYEGGKIKVKINLLDGYPFIAPDVRFDPIIYHMNVDSHGIPWIELLCKTWSPKVCIAKILKEIQEILKTPHYPPADDELGRLYRQNPSQYEKNAREWTKTHAI